MTSFDFEKMLADAGAELDQERRDRLSNAMDEIVAAVVSDAKTKVVSAVAAVKAEQNEALEVLRADIAKARETAKAAMADADRAGSSLTEKIEATENAASERMERKVLSLERRMTKLKTSRVFAELTWNDLPRKIAVGSAVFVGLIIGAALTVVTAASERRQIRFEEAFMQQRVTEMHASITHWEDVAGFKLGDHRGERVFILSEGYKFADYTPPIGAINAGNLWRIVED